jgi:predicted nucleic acid-binding protein
VDAMLTGQPRHQAAYLYLAELAVNGTNIYFNRLLELELAEAAYKIAIREQFGSKRARDMRKDGRALRRANRLANNLSTAWTDVLTNFAWGVVELQDVSDKVQPLMRRGLGSYDAVHAATAMSLGVKHLVTTDNGFGMVRESDLTIVTHSSLLGATRRHRTRNI